MSISQAVAISVRRNLANARSSLERSALTDRSQLLLISGAVYEFNRGASVSGLRSLPDADEAQLRSDILENIRLFLASDFQKVVPDDAEEDMYEAARELLTVVERLPVAS